MADIINIDQVREPEGDVFSIRQQNAELKPMEDWSGSDWEALIDSVFAHLGQQMGKSKWDILAEFMHTILTELP